MATNEADLGNLETRSEAEYLDGVSEDGEGGFVTRLCRFPVIYQAGEFRFTRTGHRMTPGQVSLEANAPMHSGPAGPHGEGVLPCELKASFTAALEGLQPRAGRSEVLGISRANIALGDVPVEFEARWQFHEQIQTDPRFTQPFTYACLRGEGAGCIFIRGTRGARGTLPLDDYNLSGCINDLVFGELEFDHL